MAIYFTGLRGGKGQCSNGGGSKSNDFGRNSRAAGRSPKNLRKYNSE